MTLSDKTLQFLEKFKGDFEKLKTSAPEILEAASVAVMMQDGPACTHIPVVIEAPESLSSKA